ncbi:MULTISPECIES: class I SAM-dependent methyltransferase [unclassified Aureimonas]|uniref:class I SAM-dependent methyltransferase n=1 Tax=unclassified Aureimonas TaxID=2615206 RepID=UPI0006F844A1|nr:MULTISPECIES: class I SAM-dependent methyltransferase [unclassified Aureimonas]KQT52415.1 methyltransferase [Aureimonas sp. Leaf427]KQT74933.1 methyltransferase [Aureimonas sp. Leaf460]
MGQSPSGTNYTLRDEIRDHWSKRAATFDDVPGHEIFSDRERRAWHRLLSRHLGPANGRRALDLASGTGVISHLLDDLGFEVTGLDWSEAMLTKAKAKARSRDRRITFRLGDAEQTREDDASFDVVVTRHLVWTLVDPAACFREWLRVLKPGGTLLIVDGDFVRQSPIERLLARLETLVLKGRKPPAAASSAPPDLAEQHRSILSRVHFKDGARAEDIASMLAECGYERIVVDTRLGAIHLAQACRMSWRSGLIRHVQHRYVVVAAKPPA